MPDDWLSTCDLVCQAASGLIVDEDDDNDGLSDIMEANAYGTDPLNPDTDNDGLSDFKEINAKHFPEIC